MDFLSDHFAQPGLLCKPLASRAGYWMPAQLDSTGLSANFDLTGWDNAWPLAEPQFVLKSELGFEHIVLAKKQSAGVGYHVFLYVKCGLQPGAGSTVLSYRKEPSKLDGDLGSSSAFGAFSSDMALFVELGRCQCMQVTVSSTGDSDKCFCY